MTSHAIHRENPATTNPALVSIISVLMRKLGVTSIYVDPEDLHTADKLVLSLDFDSGGYSIKMRGQK